MEAEFSFMCGDDATKKVAENWTKYVPKILEHSGIEINESEGINELAMLKAIQVMDNSFCPLGAAAKSDAAFTIHEVCAFVTYYGSCIKLFKSL